MVAGKHIASSATKRAGALLDADRYNQLIDFAAKMEVDVAWVIRQALDEFFRHHSAELENNPKQLALDLKIRKGN
jgi:hypothetical protein